MTSPATPDERKPSGFKPSTRRRNRIAAGVALAAFAIGGNILVYSNLNNSDPVIQVVRDVPAGELITSDMLRTVDVDADSSVNVIDGNDLEAVTGNYAKVRLVSGSLVSWDALQGTPLVGEGNAVVAIQIPEGALPVGLRERVPVELVIPADRTDAGAAPIVISAHVVALPSLPTNALGTQSLSVEVEAADAATVAAADDVRVVLSDPTAEPEPEPEPEP